MFGLLGQCREKLSAYVIAGVFASIIGTTAIAGPGDRYFCQDTDGDLPSPSRFELHWRTDGFAHVQYYQGKGNAGTESTNQIFFQDASSFVTINPDDSDGVKSFSLYDDGQSVVTVRTYVDAGYTFFERSTCTLSSN